MMQAIEYPKKSDDFAPRKQEKIGGKLEPMEDTEAVLAHQKEKEQEAEDDAIETRRTKVAAIDHESNTRPKGNVTKT